MSTIKINEQLVFMRKQHKITQEELAQFLGVTNQSVSKWESGTCCPDISLLPDIATFFHVSVDELLGYKPTDSFNDIYLKIKTIFQESPSEMIFDLAYKLSFLLHEGVASKGYKDYLPWDSDKIRSLDEDYYKWGFSACSEPEGISIMKRNTVLIGSNKLAAPFSSDKIRKIYTALQKYQDKNTLRVLLGLYDLTVSDFNIFISLKEIAEKCKVTLKDTENALDNLPVQNKPLDDGQDGYRIEGGYMHIPTILNLLVL